MIEELVDRVLKKSRHIPGSGDDYSATELLMCRQKLLFIREHKKPEITPTQSDNQRKIASMVHMGIEEVLKEMGYETEVFGKKKFGKYSVHGTVDAINDDEIVEIKVPLWAKDAIPEYYTLQIGIYMNLFDRDLARLVVIARNKIAEYEITSRLEDADILYLIESGKTPMWKYECRNCWYRKYCRYNMY